MPTFPSQLTSESLQLQNTEARMRQALGLSGGHQPANTDGHRSRQGQSRPERSVPTGRHRFVQDGDVPVTVVPHSAEHAAASSSRDRLAAAEAALQAEHAARMHAERQLQDAQAIIRVLETRLGDLGLARDAAIGAARVQEEAACALRSALKACEARLAAVQTSMQPADQVTDAESASPAASGRGRRRADLRSATRPAKLENTSPASEPQPVEWWIKARPAKRSRSA